MASLDQVNAVLQNGVTNIGLLVTAFQNAFPRITGTFTLTANATTSVIAQPATGSLAIVNLTPINSAAALTQRQQGIYHAISANVAGASFSISTGIGTATGTEQFSYIMVNPS